MKYIKQHFFYAKTRQITSYSACFWVGNALFLLFSTMHWVNAVVSIEKKLDFYQLRLMQRSLHIYFFNGTLLCK